MATATELTTGDSEARRGGDGDPRGRVGIVIQETEPGREKTGPAFRPGPPAHAPRSPGRCPGHPPHAPPPPVGPEFPRFSRDYGRRDRDGRRGGSPQEELTESPESGRRDPSPGYYRRPQRPRKPRILPSGRLTAVTLPSGRTPPSARRPAPPLFAGS